MKHLFEIYTPEDTVYYVGEQSSEKERSSGGNVEENGCGVECSQRMAKAIRQAWLPVTSEPTDVTVTGLVLDWFCVGLGVIVSRISADLRSGTFKFRSATSSIRSST